MQKLVATVPARGPWDDPTLDPGLLRYLDPDRAKALTREVVIGLASKRDANEYDWSELMDDTSPAVISRRASFMAMTIGDVAVGQFPWTGVLAAAPLPCRLTTQELVDLLKMPTCFGEARRAVLDRLGNRYGRWFVNHWAFVRFATEEGLELDFNTPPKRPDPGESVKRVLEILGQPGSRR